MWVEYSERNGVREHMTTLHDFYSYSAILTSLIVFIYVVRRKKSAQTCLFGGVSDSTPRSNIVHLYNSLKIPLTIIVEKIFMELN